MTYWSLVPEEGGQGGQELLVSQSGKGLQENESLAAGVTGGAVDVELVLLVLQRRGNNQAMMCCFAVQSV